MLSYSLNAALTLMDMWININTFTVDLRKIRLTQTDDTMHAVRPLTNKGGMLIKSPPELEDFAALHGSVVGGFCCTPKMPITKAIAKGFKKL